METKPAVPTHPLSDPADLCPPGLPPGFRIQPLFEPMTDREGLERMLLALAVHPDGAAFRRAHLLVWNPEHQWLEGRRSWSREPIAGALDRALAGARGQVPGVDDAEATRVLRTMGIPPSDLEPLLAATWNGGGSGMGTADGGVSRPWFGATQLGVVQLRGSSATYGMVIGEWETDDVEPGERQAALDAYRAACQGALVAFDDREAARRAEHQRVALEQLVEDSVSALNMVEFAQRLAQLAAEGAAARVASVWICREDGSLAMSGSYGTAGSRERIEAALAPRAAAVVETGRPLSQEGSSSRTGFQQGVPRGPLAAAPLVAHGVTCGALLVHGRSAFHPTERGGFSAQDVGFVAALARVAGLAVSQARRDDGLRRGRRELESLARELDRSERRAAIGERAIRSAQAMRNPLASIAAFAKRMHRDASPDDPNRECLEVMLREAERLETMVNDQARLKTLGPGRLSPQSLNVVIQESLQACGERLVRRRVRLLKKLAPDLPPLLLDVQHLRHVVTNLLEEALGAVAPGGRVRVETRRVQQHVVAEVAHDGLESPGDLLGQLFVPFAPEPERTDRLGLVVARQLVQAHGGEIRVRREAEWSAIYSVSLPIRDNQDRRVRAAERRRRMLDRRERYPKS